MKKVGSVQEAGKNPALSPGLRVAQELKPAPNTFASNKGAPGIPPKLCPLWIWIYAALPEAKHCTSLLEMKTASFLPNTNTRYVIEKRPTTSWPHPGCVTGAVTDPP